MNESYPRPEPKNVSAPQTRNPFGWIALAVLFGLVFFLSSERRADPSPEARAAQYQEKLRAAVTARQAGNSPFGSLLSGADDPETSLRDLEKEVASRRKTEPVEAAYWVAIRHELGEPVSPADLKPIAKEPALANVAKAYSAQKLSRAEGKELAAKLDEGGELSKLAAKFVRKKADLPAKTKPLFQPKFIALTLVFLAILCLSAIAWFTLLGMALGGQLRSFGPAATIETPAQADRFAVRAATLFATFYATSTVLGSLHLDQRISVFLTFTVMVAAVPLTLRQWPKMADVGLHGRDLGRNILLGLWGFLLELPVTMITAMLGFFLLRGLHLPMPTHPASTILQSSKDVFLIAVTFYSGAIVAPIWEETMFRGLLFPALGKVLKNPLLGALVSSFLFASIHPQGPILWGALASVALFSCALARHTRSLVPSIVMHMAHNTTLLTLALLSAGS